MAQGDVLTEVLNLSNQQADPTSILTMYSQQVNDLGNELWLTNAVPLFFVEGVTSVQLPSYMLVPMAIIYDDKQLDEMTLRQLETIDSTWRNRIGSVEAYTFEELTHKSVELFKAPTVNSPNTQQSASLFDSSVFTTLSGALPSSLAGAGITFLNRATGNVQWTSTAHTGNEALEVQAIGGGVLMFCPTLTGLSQTLSGNETFTFWYQVTDNTPQQILIEFYDSVTANWYPVYLGYNNFNVGNQVGAVSPAIGSWQSFTFSSEQMGLDTGMVITGIGFGVWSSVNSPIVQSTTPATVIFSDVITTEVVTAHNDPLGQDYQAYQGCLIFAEQRSNVLPYLELPLAMRLLQQEYSRESDHQDLEYAGRAKQLADVMFACVK